MAKIALVTGANRGIGKEIARQLIEKGFEVIATARNENKGKITAEELHTDFFKLDVTSKSDIKRLYEYINEKYQKLDILVNNAGIMMDKQDTVDMDIIRKTIETNTIAPLAIATALLPLLKKSDSPRIINLSSGMGQLSDMGGSYPGYRISKTGLNAVTRILSSENPSLSINSVCPGWVKTDMGSQNAEREVEKGAETIVWLATTENPPKGKFLRDKQTIEW